MHATTPGGLLRIMGKFELFQVVLPSHGRILTGSKLQGEVQLKVKKDMEVNRIYVMLFGGATVSFQDNLMVREGTSAACRFDDRETLISKHLVLYNRQDYNCIIMRMAKGEAYNFPFSFDVDRDLPSSFMSNISYRVTAFIDCAGKSFETGHSLTIIQDFDLNSYTGTMDLREPAVVWQPLKQPMNCTGLITGRLSIPKRGFIIGETINVDVEVHNNAKVKIENLNLCLVQTGLLRARGANNSLKAERKSRLLCKNVALGRLKSGEKLHHETVPLVVPWVVTNGLERRCKLAEVSYCLQLTTSTGLISAVTGAGAGQRVCIGPDYRRTEIVNVLCEQEIILGMRALQEITAETETDMEVTTAASPDVADNAADSVPTAVPSAPPPPQLPNLVDQDWTMFNMPSAPPSYDEAISNGVASNGSHAANGVNGSASSGSDEKPPLDVA